MKTNTNKEPVDINSWNRKEHYRFFSAFEEPFFGVTVNVDCTIAYKSSKSRNISFFLYYLYRALKAANAIENFRYRMLDGKVYKFEYIHASPTINRPDGTFGFSYMDYYEDETQFYKEAVKEIECVQKGTGLVPAISGENVIHFSTLPWLDFTSISHARSFTHPDSCPKISFGKVSEVHGVRTMPVSVHVHHALVDGFHVGQFFEAYQDLMNQ